MEKEINLFIQFQCNNDLNNVTQLQQNVEDFISSKLMYKKITDNINFYHYIRKSPKTYNMFNKKYSWITDTLYASGLTGSHNDINLQYFDLGYRNLFLKFNSEQDDYKYVLYDNIYILKNTHNIINSMSNPNEINEYHYNSLDEVYEHIKYFCLEH